MDEPNTSTVFVADDIKVAEAVIQFLASQNIPAEVYGEPTKTVSEAVTGVSEILPADRFEIRVTEPKKISDARDLLTSAERAAIIRSVQEKRLQRTGTVTAICEECGKSSEWAAATMGTTERCPHCDAYIDIPDPDDDWSGVDFGKSEEDEDAEKR